MHVFWPIVYVIVTHWHTHTYKHTISLIESIEYFNHFQLHTINNFLIEKFSSTCSENSLKTLRYLSNQFELWISHNRAKWICRNERRMLARFEIIEENNEECLLWSGASVHSFLHTNSNLHQPFHSFIYMKL